MTIFDSIKYPISDLPTEEQLGAVPEHIINEWKENNDFHDWVKIETIVKYFKYHYKSAEDYIKFNCMSSIEDLRKRIAEHDNL